jgi:16S rRNA (cytidine1402-2'-O)-methyltransferase
MSGTLYVVATPIGNLEDITLRAVRVLKEVCIIAAEDTRRTAKLLQHYGIQTPTTSFHEHNTRARIPDLLNRLNRGDSVALVSDAGTPVLSDPGLELVRACVDAGIPVDPVPGASAHLTALVASGFPADQVTLLGFAPSKANDRRRWLEWIQGRAETVVFFETPHRIRACLLDASTYLGNRPLLLGRELTKVHQEFLRGTADYLAKHLKSERGEFTVVVGPKPQAIEYASEILDTRALVDEFRQLTESGAVTRRQAIAELSRRHGRPSKEIYSTLESAKRAVS